MKLIPPFPISTIVQGFGANAVTAYAGMGLKGHPGIDFGIPWGTPIPSVADGYCYATMLKGIIAPMSYHAVFTLVDDGDVTYEISYGHCSQILATAGTQVKTGDILADVGNTGDVYQGGTEVTLAEKMSTDSGVAHRAAHLHFQVRVLRKVSMTTPPSGTQHSVNDGHGLLVINGFWYEVPDYNNGYNGCVDPAQFFDTTPTTSPYKFNHNLWFGLRDVDNIELQRRLGVSPTDQNFGPKTLLAVIQFQKANSISPAVGFVGPLTRTALNK